MKPLLTLSTYMLSEFQYMKYLEIQKSISFLAYLLIQALALNS